MDNSKRSRTWLIAGVGTLVIAGGAWGVVSMTGKKNAAPDDGSKQLLAMAKDDPGKMFDEFRAKMDDKKLSDAQRRKLGETMRNFWEGRIDEHATEYYSAKPVDRVPILNKHIDEFEKMRKQREERRKQDEEKDKDKTDKEREKDRDEWRKRMGEQSREERKAESEKRDPNKMAQRMAYMSAMRKQMKARGIEPPKWGGMGGHGGPGGRGGPH